MEDIKLFKIEEFIDELQTELNPEAIAAKSLNSCLSTVGFSSGLFFLRESQNSENYRLISVAGIRSMRKADLSAYSLIVPDTLLKRKQGDFHFSPESMSFVRREHNVLLQGFHYIFSIFNDTKSVGFLLFGKKINEEVLAEEEEKIILTLLKTASMSLRIYDQFRGLSQKMLEAESLKDSVLGISGILDIEELSRKVYTNMKGFLFPEGGLLILNLDEFGMCRVLKGDSPLVPRRLPQSTVSLNGTLIRYLAELSLEDPLIRKESLPPEALKSLWESLAFLDSEKTEYIIPITVENKIICIIIFGKSTLHSISDSSRNMFIAFLAQAKSSFQNAVQYQREEALRLRFQRYVPKQIVEDALSGKDSVGEGIQKKVVILFSDIRGFTNFCENKNPSEVVIILNEYFDFMLEAIDSTNGILDKLIGDAIMATWGIFDDREDHIENAARSALQMMQELSKFNSDRPKEKQIHIGIGLHFGEVKAGNIGGKKRSDFTIIGDSVNLASRLEGVTKQYGVGIIVSEDFAAPIRNLFIFRELDTIRVKGKREPIRIFELLGERE